MLMDKQNLLSDQQSLVLGLAGTQISNVIDLGATGTIPLGGSPVSDPGRAPKAELVAQITEDVLSAGAATMEFQLVNADNEALDSNPVVMDTTGALAKGVLVAGYQLRLRLQVGTTKRYLGMKHINAVAATTAGKLTAGIVADRQTVHI